jgi:hypothetical protein
MGCTVSTCNFAEHEPDLNQLTNFNELDLTIDNRNNIKQNIPHYKRQNSLTIDTSWGGKI